MKKLFVVLAIFAVAIVVNAQNPPPRARPGAGSQPSTEQAEAAKRGGALFKQNCAVCHGDDLTGGRGTDLIRSSVVRHDKGGNLIGPVVTQGRAEKGMPSFPLTAAQVSDLVAYIGSELALFDMHTRVPGGYPNDIPAERLATGNAEAGKLFFYGAGGCSKCHSPTGDLAGIGGKYNPPDLEQRFLYPAGLPLTATVTLPSHRQYKGVVELNDGFDVTIRDADGWTHTWPRSAVKLEVHDPAAAHQALLPKWTDAEMHDMFTYLETLK
jgi:cytochrome c oxidase cbb3-type subunit 3